MEGLAKATQRRKLYHKRLEKGNDEHKRAPMVLTPPPIVEDAKDGDGRWRVSNHVEDVVIVHGHAMDASSVILTV